MDRWVDPALMLLAASAIPLIVIETGEPSPEDLRFVVGATWLIWGAFTANFVVRMVLAVHRGEQFRHLAGDLTLIVALPLFTIGERKAIPVFALFPLLIIAVRTMQRGRVLRRTGYKLRTDPIRVVAFVVPFVWLLSAALIWRFERSIGTVDSVGDGLWWSVVTMATVGYGDISPNTTAGRVVAVCVMIVGIALFSIVTAKLAERLVTHRARAGRSEVLEQDHTLVLGWSPMVLTIVDELVVANRSRPSASVVVLADMETEKMHLEIASHVPDLERSNTTLVCRTGDPTDPVDLARCRPDRARSIIVVDPTKADSPVVRTLLALMNSSRTAGHIPIVAEIDNPSTAAALDQAFAGRVTVVNPRSFIARTAAQACRAAGVAHAYLELLGFRGSELYIEKVPGATGSTYGNLLLSFPHACVAGLIDRDGACDLNPSMDTVVDDDHSLLLISEDESVTFAPRADAPIETSPARGDHPPPEHVVIFGWNELGPLVVKELDGFLSEGSRVTVVTDPGLATVGKPPDGLTSCRMEIREAEGAEYAALVDTISDGRADHAMVLCYQNLPVAEADALALVTTLQVRQIIDRRGHDTTVVTELLDQRDVALAPPSSAGDFLVSDQLISLLLTQLSESALLRAVFDDLLDPAGAELYCKPVSRYCPPGRPVSFMDLVVAARRRQETAIGYRRIALANDSDEGFGVVINPPKSETITLDADDQLIVLAEDDR